MKKLTYWLLTAAMALPLAINGQANSEKKELVAQRTSAAPVLDGKLDEEAWKNVPFATEFIQLQPQPGVPSSQHSEVRVLYDNTALYIGAHLYDSRPDSILKELSERDNLGNTDWFGVFIDAFRDGINGFGFIITPNGVQFDAKYSTFGEDEAWDGIWESRASLSDDGWVAEIKLPYAAIRFPDVAEQTWHINFGRFIGRSQEKSFWSTIDPKKDGFLNQSGYLDGISNIKPPLRLQATPFIVLYGQHHHDNGGDPINSFGRSINGGMDVKLGLSDAFTLDMTLIPDFGEAQSDNQVLNLSPFEVRFDENRSFFTEGTELFNKGGLFYSRRVGGTPLYYYDIQGQYSEEEIVHNPVQSQLYNATKISGRTAKGLGIGFFNATSARTYATIRDAEMEEKQVLADPLTNYNVLVLDQNLPHNSYATLINTTVLREGAAYDANVTGADFLLRNKPNSYAVGGRIVASQQYYRDSLVLGHTVQLHLRKTSGHLQAGLNYLEESATYDPNDLGFIYNNNSRVWSGYVEYNLFEPFGKFNRGSFGLSADYSRLYAPSRYSSWGVDFWGFVQTRNFWELNVWGYVEPSPTYDFFEAREEGRYWRNPRSGNGGFWIGTDSRKRWYFSLNGNAASVAEPGRYSLQAYLSTRFRMNDRLNFGLGMGPEKSYNNIGFVTSIEEDPSSGEPLPDTEIIFGKRNRTTMEASFRTNYTFNANMVLSFRLRHYWSKVEYNSFHLLGQNGDLAATSYTGMHDDDFDAFNIDLVYRWRFAPGSDLFVIWKNSILSASEEVSPNYWRDLNGLFQEPQDNSLSLKLIYFLDYAALASRKGG